MTTKTLEKPAENEQEQDDGFDNASDQENNTNELEQGGEENINAGGTDQEDGVDGGTDESEGGEEGGEPQELDPRDSQIKQLQDQIAELSSKFKGVEDKRNEEPPARELSEEEWVKLEEERGVPRQGQKFFAGMVSSAMNNIWSKLDQRLSRFEKDSALQSLSQKPEFKNIMAFRTGIDDYLKKFNPSMHSNEEVLVDAYYHAKGRSSDKNVRRAINDKVLSKRVITNSKLNAPNRGTQSKSGLSKEEEQGWQQYGRFKFKTKEEYVSAINRWKRK